MAAINGPRKFPLIAASEISPVFCIASRDVEDTPSGLPAISIRGLREETPAEMMRVSRPDHSINESELKYNYMFAIHLSQSIRATPPCL